MLTIQGRERDSPSFEPWWQQDEEFGRSLEMLGGWQVLMAPLNF